MTEKGYQVTKDPEILALLEALRGSLGENSFRVVDRWDADLCAIGIANVAKEARLVYVSTFDQSPGRYSFELEVPDEGADPPHQTVGAGEDVDFEELLRVVEEHLREESAG